MSNNYRLAQYMLILLSIYHTATLAAPTTKLWAFWQANNPKQTLGIRHTEWNTLLKKYLVKSSDGINRFNYSAVTPADKAKLKTYIAKLSQVRITQFAAATQMAYWINLYNALTVQVVLVHYPVASIRDITYGSPLAFWLVGPWDEPLITVQGKTLTLNDIEHRILRPIFKDNRIHYAINCASLGCPNLQSQAFTAKNLNRQLNRGAIAFINHPRAVQISGKTLKLSQIYAWFADDFGHTQAQRLGHLAHYARPKLKKALQALGTPTDIDYHYDWQLNDVHTP